MSVMSAVSGVISHSFNHQGSGAVWTLLWMVWHCWTRLDSSQLISLCTTTTLRMQNSSLRVLRTFLHREQLLSKCVMILYVWTDFQVIFCSRVNVFLPWTCFSTTVLKYQECANACHCKASVQDLISPLIDLCSYSYRIIYEIAPDVPE